MRSSSPSDRCGSSRRQFLAHSALATAGVALPYLVPRAAWGANDRLGIAGIGIGRQGTGVLANAIKSERTRFVGIADVNLPRAKQLCERFKGGEPYQDYRKLLERKDVDAIVTATPDHWRAIVTVHACQAGKHVYAEKPASLTIHEGRVMVKAARKYKRVVQIGSQQRSQAVNRLTCEYIRTGKFGKVTEVIGCNYSSPWECGLPAQPIPDGLDWDMWCGPTEVVPFHPELYIPRGKPGWISFRPYSGGEMTGWGAHGLDQIQWALGMDESGPVEIWTEGEKFAPPTYTEPEAKTRGDKVCAIPAVCYRYANGVTLKLGKASGGGGIFISEQGKIDLTRGKVSSNPPEIAAAITKQAAKKDESHVLNWLDCIGSGKRPNADVEIGHRSATVCHLGNIARWLGRKLRWDPAAEKFPDDAEANQYLDRQRRKPYLLPENV